MPRIHQLSPPVPRIVAYRRLSSREPSRTPNRQRWAWILLLAALAGCRGRAEFARGTDFYEQGRYRDAYRQFWEAYRLSPSEEYRAACRRAATRVAVGERLRGQLREGEGDLQGALEAYSLGLEYDPRLPSLRYDYARMWATLARWQRLTWELEGAGPRSITTWAQLRAFRTLTLFPSSPDAWRRDFPLAVRSVAEAAIGPLVRATQGAPLPRTEPALEALIAAWERFREECRLYAWEEENAARNGSWGAGATSRWVEVREVLRPFVEEAEEAVRELEAARRALRLVEEGEQFERSGDLVRALRSYRRARFEQPGYEAAGDAEDHVVHHFSSVSMDAAREAMDKEDWETAVRLLEELLRVTPDDAHVRKGLSLSRSQLAEECAMTARRHADAGRPGTALLFASRAADLEPATGEALARELRRPIVASFWPRLSIRLRSASSDEWKLRRDLWAVGEPAMRRLEVAVLDAARGACEEVEGSLGRLYGGEDGGATGVLWVEDLEFSFSRGVELAGAERFRHVGDFGLTDNQDHHQAIGGLAVARRQLESLLARRERARLPGRALAEELTRLARWRVRQLEVQVQSLPRAVAEIDWGEFTHETAHLRREARLSGYVRLGARSEWISVEREFLDRVARGRPELSLASDPREAPSREEVLIELAGALGRALVERVGEWRRERLADLLREGGKELEAGNRTRAAERLALVCYGSGDHYPELRRAASESLRRLLGWTP